MWLRNLFMQRNDFRDVTVRRNAIKMFNKVINIVYDSFAFALLPKKKNS